jgi:hypothetical protein
MLHLVSLGWFKYCLEAFASQAGGEECLALKRYDRLCVSIGTQLSRHSDRDLPRMNFPKGFSSGTNLMGHKITGCLMVKLFALHTTRFRQIFPPKSVSPFLVCWDAWLCRSYHHGGFNVLSSGARISVIPCFAVEPLAAPCLGCQQNSFWNGQQTEVDSPIMVKTVHLTSLAASLLATRLLSVALLYSGHCSLFTTFSTGTSQYQCFLWNYSQQLVPVYITSSGCLLFCRTTLYCATTDSPATGGLSTIPPLLLQPYEYYVLVLLYSSTITTSAAA